MLPVKRCARRAAVSPARIAKHVSRVVGPAESGLAKADGDQDVTMRTSGRARSRDTVPESQQQRFRASSQVAYRVSAWRLRSDTRLFTDQMRDPSGAVRMGWQERPKHRTLNRLPE